MGNTSQAVAYLQQGLAIAEMLGRREEEARIRHRLGLALWGNGQLELAQTQLEQAASLLESIRRETRGSSDYKLSLFDLQTASYQALQVINTLYQYVLTWSFFLRQQKLNYSLYYSFVSQVINKG